MIVATDKVLTVGDSFDPLKDVTADDPEDGQIIIKSEHVIKNEVNTKVPGKYEVIYRVADKEGLATEKTIIVGSTSILSLLLGNIKKRKR